MKGKKILALVSIFASAAIAGGTFAAWAVTDNANPFGVKISPGEISDDTTTQFATLAWGTRTTANVDSIVNQTIRSVGSVALESTWDYSDTTYTFQGQFTPTLSTSATGENKLIDYLKIYVLDAAPTVGEGGVIAEIDNGHVVSTLSHAVDSAYTKDININLTNTAQSNTGTKTLWLAVEYDAPAQYVETFSTQEVTLTLDWKKINELLNGLPVYYYGSVANPGVYAWSASGQNASHPGKDMTAIDHNLYQYEIATSFTSFLVTNKDTSTNITADDISISGQWFTNYNAGKKYYIDGMKVANGTENDYYSGWDVAPEFYVVGDFNLDPSDSSKWILNDEDYKMTLTATGAEISGVELAAGKSFKVYSPVNGGVYFTDSDLSQWAAVAALVDIDTTHDNNLKVKTSGTYTIRLYRNGDNGNFIEIVSEA